MPYTIRPMVEADLTNINDYCDLLRQLSTPGTLSLETAQTAFRRMIAQGSQIFVAVDATNRIIGTITLLLEQKFYRGGKLAGHLEDIIVRTGYEKQGIGKALMSHAVTSAVQAGCYKIILDADEQLAPFYEACGFGVHGVFMRKYLD